MDLRALGGKGVDEPPDSALQAVPQADSQLLETQTCPLQQSLVPEMEVESEGEVSLAQGRVQRVDVFNFGTDRVRVLEKTSGSGSGTDRVRVLALHFYQSGIIGY